MRKIKLLRTEDVSGKSGVGEVWEGVNFSNELVAGKWRHEISSFCIYPNIDSLEKIHSHEGKTTIENSDLGEIFYLLFKKKENNNLAGEGYIFSDKSVVITFLGNYFGVYYFKNIEEMIKIYGDNFVYG